MSATLIWPRRSIGSSCQIGNMAALLNSLFLFVFKMSFLPKYRVIYYDYIVKGAVGYNVIGVYRWILPKC